MPTPAADTLSCDASIGKKSVMAATGIVLFLFVLGHLAGNLQIYAGQNAINAYAEKLRDLGALLWAARIFLLASVAAHIAVGVRLKLENRRARPIPYGKGATVQATGASRTMMASGLAVLAFIVYHLLHFTFRVAHPEFSHLTDGEGRHDVYSMMVLSFQNRWISVSYVAAMALLAFHLSHGAWSMLQTLGLHDPRFTPWLQRLAGVGALLIFLAYSSIPLAVARGFVCLPPGLGAGLPR